MSSSLQNLEKQSSLFARDPSVDGVPPSLQPDDVPDHLKRAALRMRLPPSYVIVGVYRLLSDRTLWQPTWDKCKHGFARGAAVGAVWAFLTFSLQRGFIRLFLSNSPKITGLGQASFLGIPLPFDVPTYAALLYLADQVTFIIQFFLSKNMRIARDRAWQHTVASRGKGPEFFQSYVEEWDVPPKVVVKQGFLEKAMSGPVGLFVLKRLIMLPLGVYPIAGTLVSAWFRALGTAKSLHRRYFEAKKMTPYETAVFMEERKWDYRSFGFVAALLEGLPLVGLVFMISNRVGAAMWAFDLEKNQHYVKEEKAMKKR